MSVTSGFFNSLDGDRKYDALQFSSMFDSLIVDGVFASIGTAFVVQATTGLVVNVGIGRAWFNSTWILNDAILPLTMPDSEVLLDRIDAIVIEANTLDSVRETSIKIITGEPASSPVRPTMTSKEDVHQYPLCYINRAAGSISIRQSDITNMVGTEETPFVTGILQTISLEELLGKWQDELDNFVDHYTENMETWTEEQQAEFLEWANSRKEAYAEWLEEMKLTLSEEQAELDQWIATEQADFLAWYESMKGQLSEDSAGNLQIQIDDVAEQAFNRYYDLVNETVSINRDSTGNVTSIIETSSEAVCTTTSEKTDTGKIITTIIVPDTGLYDYTRTVNIAKDGVNTLITTSYTKNTKGV